tara:strand:+ start:48 stop:284 length:237 start_codon:yes stop_codon:yes gene_type:complete
MNENILIENAILAFLHHYPEHNWVGDYKILLEKTRNAKSKNTTVQKRGRPAKRQRTKTTTSSKVSKEESKDVETKTIT